MLVYGFRCFDTKKKMLSLVSADGLTSHLSVRGDFKKSIQFSHTSHTHKIMSKLSGLSKLSDLLISSAIQG